MKYLEFRNKDKMPILGLGTWKSNTGQVYEAVREAIRLGYRHVDCAAAYGNEAEIGQAFSDAFAGGDVKREELWVTSKLWNADHEPRDVRPALEKSLEALKLDYLDLYLMHWPVALRPEVSLPEKPEDFRSLDEVPISATWKAMEACLEAKLTRHIGVSNFNIGKLEELIKTAGIQPEINQVELHPFLRQKKLVAYCRSKGILLTAYSPLGSSDRPERMKATDEPALLEHPVIREVAEANEVTPGQVLIGWSINRGIAVIPKSTNKDRLKENFAASTLTLNKDEIERIGRLDQKYRFINGSLWTMEGSPYEPADLWDD